MFLLGGLFHGGCSAIWLWNWTAELICRANCLTVNITHDVILSGSLKVNITHDVIPSVLPMVSITHHVIPSGIPKVNTRLMLYRVGYRRLI